MRLQKDLFAVLWTVWTVFLGILFLPFLLLPRRFFRAPRLLWLDGTLYLVRRLLKISWRLEGAIPAQHCIIAAQHQSMLETFILARHFPEAAFVLKRELLWLPIFGWYLGKTAPLALNRRAGITALRRLKNHTQPNRSIIIFPEGTRQRPGAHAALLPGVGVLAEATKMPVIPLTLNTGAYWPKDWRLIKPGIGVLRFHPALKETGIRDTAALLRAVYAGGQTT